MLRRYDRSVIVEKATGELAAIFAEISNRSELTHDERLYILSRLLLRLSAEVKRDTDATEAEIKQLRDRLETAEEFVRIDTRQSTQARLPRRDDDPHYDAYF